MTTISPAEAVKEIRESIHKYDSAATQMRSESGQCFVVERIDYVDELSIQYQGMEFPERGVALAEDIYMFNIVKRLFIETLRLFTRFPSLNSLVHWFNEIAIKATRGAIIKDELLTPMGRELIKLIEIFLREAGVYPNEAHTCAEIVGNMINIDNAYRYRIQDLFDETTPEKLSARPITEIRRLIRLNQERDDKPVAKKFKVVLMAVTIALLSPKIRRAFRKAAASIDYYKLCPDKTDLFWMCYREDYKFFGMDTTKRRQLINHLKVAKPMKMKR